MTENYDIGLVGDVSFWPNICLFAGGFRITSGTIDLPWGYIAWQGAVNEDLHQQNLVYKIL